MDISEILLNLNFEPYLKAGQNNWKIGDFWKNVFFSIFLSGEAIFWPKYESSMSNESYGLFPYGYQSFSPQKMLILSQFWLWRQTLEIWLGILMHIMVPKIRINFFGFFFIKPSKITHILRFWVISVNISQKVPFLAKNGQKLLFFLFLNPLTFILLHLVTLFDISYFMTQHWPQCQLELVFCLHLTPSKHQKAMYRP